MNEILQSLKSDLLDRRLLPILLALGLALAGAVAYAVLAGGGGSTRGRTPLPSAAAGSLATHSSPSATLAVQQAPANPHAAVAETTEGAPFQHKLGSRDPFTPLPSTTPKTKSATPSGASSATSTPASTSTPSSPGSTSSPASSGGAGATTPSPPAPRKPKVVHKFVAVVSVLFGLAPTTSGQLSQLTPYAAVKRLEPLPSASDPMIVFEGVSSDKQSAVFMLAREAILKGGATCLPSASQCEAIDLPLGQTEELSYLEPDGQTVAYELGLEAIAWREVTYAKAARLDRGNHAGEALLRRLDPSVQGDLRFSSARGVLLYSAHHGA
jgi:hypothetical protein